jgi:hypothetical protein
MGKVLLTSRVDNLIKIDEQHAAISLIHYVFQYVILIEYTEIERHEHDEKYNRLLANLVMFPKNKPVLLPLKWDKDGYKESLHVMNIRNFISSTWIINQQQLVGFKKSIENKKDINHIIFHYNNFFLQRRYPSSFYCVKYFLKKINIEAMSLVN